MVFLLSSCSAGLFGSPGEDEPAVERGSPASAAGAWLDPNGVGHTFDGISEADILIADESWKSYSIRLLAGCCAFGVFFGHDNPVLG
jgi:hypothetical protein